MLAGLVPSSPTTALMQWAGRSNVLFLVVNPIIQVAAARPQLNSITFMLLLLYIINAGNSC